MLGLSPRTARRVPMGRLRRVLAEFEALWTPFEEAYIAEPRLSSWHHSPPWAERAEVSRLVSGEIAKLRSPFFQALLLVFGKGKVHGKQTATGDPGFML